MRIALVANFADEAAMVQELLSEKSDVFELYDGDKQLAKKITPSSNQLCNIRMNSREKIVELFADDEADLVLFVNRYPTKVAEYWVLNLYDVSSNLPLKKLIFELTYAPRAELPEKQCFLDCENFPPSYDRHLKPDNLSLGKQKIVEFIQLGVQIKTHPEKFYFVKMPQLPTQDDLSKTYSNVSAFVAFLWMELATFDNVVILDEVKLARAVEVSGRICPWLEYVATHLMSVELDLESEDENSGRSVLKIKDANLSLFYQEKAFKSRYAQLLWYSKTLRRKFGQPRRLIRNYNDFFINYYRELQYCIDDFYFLYRQEAADLLAILNVAWNFDLYFSNQFLNYVKNSFIFGFVERDAAQELLVSYFARHPDNQDFLIMCEKAREILNNTPDMLYNPKLLLEVTKPIMRRPSEKFGRYFLSDLSTAKFSRISNAKNKGLKRISGLPLQLRLIQQFQLNSGRYLYAYDILLKKMVLYQHSSDGLSLISSRFSEEKRIIPLKGMAEIQKKLYLLLDDKVVVLAPESGVVVEYIALPPGTKRKLTAEKDDLFLLVDNSKIYRYNLKIKSFESLKHNFDEKTLRINDLLFDGERLYILGRILEEQLISDGVFTLEIDGGNLQLLDNFSNFVLPRAGVFGRLRKINRQIQAEVIVTNNVI
ncbi:MAG: hypothetical protein RRY34_05860, partial [Victivallaceae bacterium]